MTLRQIIRQLRQNPKDALYYLQGNLRYWLLQHPQLRGLLRGHITEQYVYRKKAATGCYMAGSCKACGCETPHLFFADKGCQAGSAKYPHTKNLPTCYPPMMGKADWDKFNKHLPYEFRADNLSSG